ncbi:c53cde2d-d4c6-4509-9030-ee10061bbd79 [Thermothielavioides terrestris]|uniref:C53cde2d-d4c6-4509-9030-ee10061bbd79 n=1 Tax=Thermothielavioides terrestris TaxID=2587410 RepID=A0A446BXP6_9PEZI|nr:c53cde2d-d4c6-4509-9030-ee10061bbd79 [Thermothielavioides terrestris]
MEPADSPPWADEDHEVHEVGVARQVVVSSGRAQVVTVGSSPAPVRREEAKQADDEEYDKAVRTANWARKHAKLAANIPKSSSHRFEFEPSTPPESPRRESDSANLGNSGNLGDSGNSHQGHRRAPDDSAILGNFIPLSTSMRERSPSPRREKGVYLQLSLTDSQVDKLTAALSSQDDDESMENNPARSLRARSPAKMPQDVATHPRPQRSRSPAKKALPVKTPESQRTVQGLRGDIATSASSSKRQETRFDWNAPAAHGSPTRSAGRGIRSPPAPIDTDRARAYAKLAADRAGRQPAIVVHRPLERDPSPVRQPHRFALADDSSSHYSQDSAGERYPSCVSPLRIQKENEAKNVSILQEYTEQKNSVRGSDKDSTESAQYGTLGEGSSGGQRASYTPLAPLMKEAPTVRKASKTLIGEGGWLENTSKREPATTSPNRAGGFLGNLIEASHDNRAQRKSRESDESRPTSRQLAISLSPREQSLLYCELEFALTSALNEYITTQFNNGRLEADKLKKVADDWQRKGRPKVVGFRYDLETQLDLVRMHVNDFMFYSRAATTTAILGIIDTAKANARVLRIRTFCQPDTVIAKQLLDSQSLFNILGCRDEQQIKLAEIIGFFKAAIQRDRMHAREEQQQHHEQQQQQPHQQHQQGAAAPSAVTSPLRNGRSPGQAGDDRWGTAAAAGQLRRSKSHAVCKMDPADI